ncbi:hypothetical protein M408DRAFT_59462 [Serendipita vermifera MAFF 305830]|uniref:glutathione transferase n=1 Tax=Serendipita vermifera MAFF 305830 TaxID=933852 RepID=A0A0C3BC04_SERVB|nr:hypothetical protein M408DRAFT_59462 [Serendipita vermifera MAFF 305830]
MSTTSEQTGLVLHHLENSRSQRVLWLLEELEVPYTIKHYKRLPTMLAPPELLKVHPLGKSPVITDGGVTIAESGAIVEYLLEKYDTSRRFSPTNDPKGQIINPKITNLYYTHFGEGTLMPYVTNHLVFTMVPQRAPWFLRWLLKPIFNKVRETLVVKNVRKAADMIENDLEKSSTGWFAGGSGPTSADFQMLFPMETLPRAMGDDAGPKTKAWVELAHSRPAYKRALEKGGRYAYAKL